MKKIYAERDQSMTWSQGQAGLAKLYTPSDYGSDINVTNDFPWTLAPKEARKDTPYVILKEYEFNEGTLKRAAYRYARGAGNALEYSLFGQDDPLEPYQNLFPKDNPTGFKYYMPYFSDINFQVTTAQWTALDQVEGIGKAAKGLTGLIAGSEAANALGTGAEMLKQALGTGLATLGGYPKVGATDRPKMWESHSERSIDIKFSLFNTLAPDDWILNRELCMLLVNQNLYNKRDLITSLPPVFYEVLVPGQHYSYASCVTNITIGNKGNMRKLPLLDKNMSCVVPDAYDVTITLTDMVMPSKNLFQQIENPKVFTKLQSPGRGD
jgi:hypothetical protein